MTVITPLITPSKIEEHYHGHLKFMDATIEKLRADVRQRNYITNPQVMEVQIDTYQRTTATQSQLAVLIGLLTIAESGDHLEDVKDLCDLSTITKLELSKAIKLHRIGVIDINERANIINELCVKARSFESADVVAAKLCRINNLTNTSTFCGKDPRLAITIFRSQLEKCERFGANVVSQGGKTGSVVNCQTNSSVTKRSVKEVEDALLAQLTKGLGVAFVKAISREPGKSITFEMKNHYIQNQRFFICRIRRDNYSSAVTLHNYLDKLLSDPSVFYKNLTKGNVYPGVLALYLKACIKFLNKHNIDAQFKSTCLLLERLYYKFNRHRKPRTLGVYSDPLSLIVNVHETHGQLIINNNCLEFAKGEW